MIENKVFNKVFNNKFAIFIIILIVIGLFLHYEMGYNLDFFTVSGHRSHRNHRHDRRKRYDHDRDHRWYHHLFPNDYSNLNSRIRRANEHHKEHHSGPPNPDTPGINHSVETF